MSSVEVKAKVLEWGNSYGFRLSRQDFERLHLKLNTEVPIQVPVESKTIRVDQMRSFDLGGDAADRHDELFGRSVDNDLKKGRK